MKRAKRSRRLSVGKMATRPVLELIGEESLGYGVAIVAESALNGGQRAQQVTFGSLAHDGVRHVSDAEVLDLGEETAGDDSAVLLDRAQELDDVGDLLRADDLLKPNPRSRRATTCGGSVPLADG